MKTRTRAALMSLVVLSGIGVSVVASTAPAWAYTYYQVNVDEACAEANGMFWQGWLLDSGNPYSWRCVAPPFLNVQRGVDLLQYCQNNGYTDVILFDSGDPYSWYCRS